MKKIKKISLLKNKIKKLYNKPFIVKLRNSLFFNTIRVFILVICLLIIIFSCSPKTAHVFYSSTDIDNIGGIVADQMKMQLETNMLSFSDFSKISIRILHCDSIEIDDKSYSVTDNSYKIVIESKNISDDFYFFPFGLQDNIKCYISSIYDRYYEYEESPLSINFINLGFSAKSKIGFDFEIENDISLLFDDYSVYLEKDGIVQENIHQCHVNKSEYQNIKLSIEGISTMKVVQYQNDYKYSKAQIEFLGIKTITSKGSGLLNFSYTLNPNEYELNNQELNLQAENYSLKANLTYDKIIKKYEVTGIVKRAYLSGLNLFPSFMGWYRDNVYLAPLTLITTVLGAVSLTNKKQEK